MAEMKTIARPYARAAFAIAREHDEVALWRQTLAALSPLAANDSLRAYLYGPLWIGQRVAGEILASLSDKNERIERFITQLAKVHRLPLLKHIHQLFEQYAADAQGQVRATITSALPLDEQARALLLAALEKRFDKSVVAVCHTDETLLSGVMVRAGDLVMDGTISSCLARLADTLEH